MPSGSPPRRAALLVGVVVLGVLVLVLVLTSGGGKGSSSLAVSSSAGGGFDGAALPSPHYAPDFTLRDQSGRSVSLASLRGRPVVLAFLYPGCGRGCVLVAEQIRGALDDLPHPVPVVIVDAGPSPSPPAAVKRFLDEVSLSGRALFLEGRPQQLQTIRRSYRVEPASAGAAAFGAAAEVRVLDAQGRERVVFGTEQLTPEGLAHDIARLQGGRSEGG